jgi:hypothetical protein
MSIQEYFNQDWRKILQHNQVDSFEQLWRLNEGNWFEPPNQRRGGWSGVMHKRLALPEGGDVGVFVKYQENHVYRSWKNFFQRAATFEREFRNLKRCKDLGVATPEPVYFGQRDVDGARRAILVTLELDGYQPFDSKCYKPISKLDRPRRKRFIQSVASALRQMHFRHIQFNCLYLKHIFVKENADGSVDVRFIDLEKAKWRFSRRLIAIHDLCSLNRRAFGWSRTDRMRLFFAYRQESHLSQESKHIIREVYRRADLKGVVEPDIQ